MDGKVAYADMAILSMFQSIDNFMDVPFIFCPAKAEENPPDTTWGRGVPACGRDSRRVPKEEITLATAMF
jgi:hypothetical protein